MNLSFDGLIENDQFQNFEKYFEDAKESFENRMVDISEAISQQIGETKKSIEKTMTGISQNHLDSIVELNAWILIALLVILVFISIFVFTKRHRKIEPNCKATFTRNSGSENNHCNCAITV